MDGFPRITEIKIDNENKFNLTETTDNKLELQIPDQSKKLRLYDDLRKSNKFKDIRLEQTGDKDKICSLI